MYKLITLSRSVQSNISFKKKLYDDYSIHKRKIEYIMARYRNRHSESNQYLEMMHKSKQAKQRIASQYNSTNLENKALLYRLTNISRRKFQSINSVGERYKKENNVDEMKRIEQENYILKKRIEDQRKNVLTKEDIRKEMKGYFEIRKKLRKVHNSLSLKKLN